MDSLTKEDSGGWSWEENKLFELALAVVDEEDPGRWQEVSAMVGGRSPEEVEKHYVILLQDLQFIESGLLDYELEDVQPSLQVDCTHTQVVFWTHEDNSLLVSLDINWHNENIPLMRKEKESS